MMPDSDESLQDFEAAGEVRKLGQRPPPVMANVSDYNYGAIELLPRSEWVEFDYRKVPGFNSTIRVLDQNGKGACNGHAAASSLEINRWLAGMTHVDLSPWMIYAILCGGRDVGSNIGQALQLLQKTGTCPFGDVPYATINPNRLTQANYKAAADHKIEIGQPAINFDELMTLTQLHVPFNFSLHVGGSFNNLDADGCPPVQRGAGNHAITGGLGAKKNARGEWMILWMNSWSTKWGLGGFAWFKEGHISTQSWFEAYGVKAAFDAPGDPRNPPVAK